MSNWSFRFAYIFLVYLYNYQVPIIQVLRKWLQHPTSLEKSWIFLFKDLVAYLKSRVAERENQLELPPLQLHAQMPTMAGAGLSKLGVKNCTWKSHGGAGRQMLGPTPALSEAEGLKKRASEEAVAFVTRPTRPYLVQSAVFISHVECSLLKQKRSEHLEIQT